MPTTQIELSERALLGRLNRALAREGEGKVIKVARYDSRLFQNFGRYYSVINNTVQDWHIDLQQWAREMNVIRPYERFAE